ncbi:unnamed protein product [Cyprideis torosa]|uniref:Glutamate--cysteine ligase n=1 Tax=Cyprideis torosa TaxID=163714 RepID=A0A7R8WBU4_9CRUS|nr:unnamed protein product [Cyprideis torosa]CAG0886843.1 unnamed protein product [Cyprideis torosa]
MGLLAAGKPLSWAETKRIADQVKSLGIQQFIKQFHAQKNRSGDDLFWGDETEYMIVRFDDSNKIARVSLRAEEILRQWEELDPPAGPIGPIKRWVCEYAAYMLESTPQEPYSGQALTDLLEVEPNMRRRRREIQHLLDPDEALITITSFPRLGCPEFTSPVAKPTPGKGATQSWFFPDEAIFQGHPRFSTLTRNIRERRGKKVRILRPVFVDAETPSPFMEPFPESLPGAVYMDAMGFGMGCCCTQMTLQSADMKEAILTYDQLIPVTPILLCLSAASPIFKGFLTDRDCRWDVISAAVDCRTDSERGIGLILTLHGEERRPGHLAPIPKSRYSSVDCYLSQRNQMYNDIEFVVHDGYFQEMVQEEIPVPVARHIAHLFVRDPLVVYKESLQQPHPDDTSHFENIQTSNWQSLRFKPPPSRLQQEQPGATPTGWRIEVRTIESQPTDFENAAYVIFTYLLSRTILMFGINLVTSISRVDENMRRAQHRDAVTEEKFWFRKNILSSKKTGSVPSDSDDEFEMLLDTVSSIPRASYSTESSDSVDEECLIRNERNFSAERTNVSFDEEDNEVLSEDVEMTADEIINGSNNSRFPGLLHFIRRYLNHRARKSKEEREASVSLESYLKLIEFRASGRIPTVARWMRDLVAQHPNYAKDSVVSDEINYDILNAMRNATPENMFPIIFEN